MADFTPYSTVAAFGMLQPSWVPELDRDRLAAYTTYEQIYWTQPETFKLVVRGTEDKPIYLPSGRIICDTMNRFMCKGLDVVVEPLEGGTPGTEQAEVKAFLDRFLRREAFRTEFSSAKLYGIIRGDWVFHVYADPNKPEGSRVSVKAIDPASWFPVYDDADPDKLIKVHIAEEFVLGDDVVIRRQTYERTESGQIVSSLGLYDPEPDAWLEGRPLQVLIQPTLLDARITAFPVYAIKNFVQPQNPFGSSEMRGLERVMAGMNQAMSDEDLTLAMDGLGVYATSESGPVNEAGQDVPWIIGPGRVIENVPEDFRRVNGTSNVGPYQDHLNALWSFMKMATGAGDAAVGSVDVAVAESGIALRLQMGPILARAADKEAHAVDVLNQMFYDLMQWFAVYEGINSASSVVSAVFGDPLPENKEKAVEMILSMVAAKIMSTATARKHLAKFGYVFGQDEDSLIANATASEAAAVDPFPARAAAELEG